MIGKPGSIAFKIAYLLICLWIGPAIPAAAAQTDDPEPGEPLRIPAVKPPNDFYGAAGTGVAVTAQATPATLTPNDWLTLTLTVSHLLNASEVEKPKLTKLEDFAKRFQIDEQLPDGNGLAHQRIWIYRLRPRSTSIDAVPPFTFRYFDPKRQVPPGRDLLAYATVWTASIPLSVEPPPETSTLLSVPIMVPTFAETVPDENLLGKRDDGVDGWATALWLLLWLLPLVVAVGWAIVWKQCYPDAARLTRLLRSKAARKAWATLNRATAAATVTTAIYTYLQERHGLPSTRNTLPEIVGYLSAAHTVSGPALDALTILLRDCDAARFAPFPAISTAELGRRAADCIALLEEPA